MAAMKRIKVTWMATVAEAKVAYYGAQLVNRLNYWKIIIESDCLSFIQRLNNPSSYLSELDRIIDDLVLFRCHCTYCFWSHVRRDGNTAALHIARVLPSGTEQVWLGVCPSPISSYVLKDTLSMQ